MQQQRRQLKLLIALFSLLLGCLAACAEELDLSLPANASIGMVQTTAEKIVDTFVERVSQTVGAVPAGAIPRVTVRNTPNLVYFDHRRGEIVTPHWKTLDAPARSFFFSLVADNDSEQASRLFTSLFNGFLLAHEMTHWLQRTCGLTLDRYTSESMANDLAVAFFMDFEGGESELLALQQQLQRAISRLNNPTPAGENAAVYFNTHYAELARDASLYGYYQFGFIIDSIDRRSKLGFEDFIRGMCRP